MLGAARASEYAGWWNQKLSVDFTGSGAMANRVYQQPAYSWNTNNTNTNWGCVTTGTIDLTGLTGFTNYSPYRATYVTNFYLPSSSWTSGMSANQYLSWPNELNIGGTISYFNCSLNIVSGNALRFGYQPGSGGNINVDTPTAYTNYRDTWITAVASQAQASSAFTGWSASTSGQLFVRVCLFNTATGVLIAKTDQAFGSYTPPALGSLPSSISSGSGSNSLSQNGFGVSTHISLTSNWWISFGQMFDPVAATNTSWRTSSPSAEIENCKAWVNAQYTNIVTSGSEEYGAASGQDLYSQTNNRLLDWYASGARDFAAGYNTTDIIKDSS